MATGKRFWGRREWNVLHAMPGILGDSNIESLTTWLELSTKLLPCAVCKTNLIEKLRNYPPPYSNARDAMGYIYLIHDMVNQHVNLYHDDKKVSPPLDDVIGRYSSDPYNTITFFLDEMWATLQSRAVMYRPEYAVYFRDMMRLVSTIVDPYLQGTFKSTMDGLPIEPYLRNNHDLFFYLYQIRKRVDRTIGKRTPPFNELKSEHFLSLGATCGECMV